MKVESQCRALLSQKSGEDLVSRKMSRYVWDCIQRSKKNAAMKLPEVSQTPILLQRLQWIADPIGYMDAAVQDYGDIFAAPLGKDSRPLVFVSNPQALQQILTNDPKEFTAPGEFNEILKPLLGDYSVILVSGDRHHRQRQLLMPPFHGERMRAYGQLICDITQEVMSQLTPGKIFSARSAMQEISLEIILNAVFGIHKGERFQTIKRLMSSQTEIFKSPLAASFLFFPSLQKDLGPWSPWGHFSRLRKQIDELLYAEIQERREQYDPSRTDILTLLLSARVSEAGRDSVSEAGEPMTDVELHDELLTLLFAGHETTATAMAWALYWVHHLPDVGEKLLKELATLGDSPDPISISRLPYLTAVCQETLRIYPVGMLTFPRVVRSPVKLMDYELEPDTVLMGCIYLTHHREDLYPEAKQFKPERFLERQFSAYEYLPFGGGSRRCIGMALAQFEMKLVLATILSSYQLALAEQRPVRAKRRGVTLAPVGGVKMVVKSATTQVRSRQLKVEV
ncbi:MAG TPA: cytochrome P450 [Coleofasciculaceae cyanobacterium]|jgi:cytochrome P450